ncbi:MAG: hypothetical protein LBD79_05745 [Treponema sp.]|jgi:hypothetical protein|nr:hypothetical protein [Treponema sp.]
MKLNKVFSLILGMGLFVFPVFSQTTLLTDLQTRVNEFSESLVKSLPFNAAIGLNWSDAYIGKVFPSLPPHFGVGVSAGMTSMEIDAFKGLLDMFDAGALGSVGDLTFMPVPAYATEARVGGVFLPFDLGFKFGILPENSLSLGNVKLSYTLLGASLRIAPLELLLSGNPLLLVLPNISVGVGVNYLSGGIGDISIGKAINFSFTLPGKESNSYTLGLSEPKLGLSWETTALDFTLQASKNLLVITPYIGVGVSRATSKAGYGVTTKVKYTENSIDKELTTDAELKNLRDKLESARLGGIDVDANGFESIIENSGVSFRAFGGLSFNIAVIKIDLTGMFNFTDQNWGVSLGTRFQL